MEVKLLCIRPVLLMVLAGAALVALGDRFRDFLNLAAFAITIGGTLAVSLCSFSWAQIREASHVVTGLLTARTGGWEEQLEEIKRLAHLHRVGGPRALESQEEAISDPFLRRGIAMVADLAKADEIRERLLGDAGALLSRQESARQVLTTVGKLLPAFGLIGTLIGLVLVMREVSAPGSAFMSSALSTAVLTTLYGAVFANVLVFPLAARLQSDARCRETALRLTIDGVLLIAQGESPQAIDRALKWSSPSAKAAVDAFSGEWLLSRR